MAPRKKHVSKKGKGQTRSQFRKSRACGSKKTTISFNTKNGPVKFCALPLHLRLAKLHKIQKKIIRKEGFHVRRKDGIKDDSDPWGLRDTPTS